jgi:hypothetical protein
VVIARFESADGAIDVQLGHGTSGNLWRGAVDAAVIDLVAGSKGHECDGSDCKANIALGTSRILDSPDRDYHITDWN